jgi:hypothetical protein
MDDESKQLLRLLIDAQREQTELLRKHVLPLWTRIRFSLLALLALMTLMATAVGFTAWAVRSMNASTPMPQTATTIGTAPTATLQVWTAPAPVDATRTSEIPSGMVVPTLVSP